MEYYEKIILILTFIFSLISTGFLIALFFRKKSGSGDNDYLSMLFDNEKQKKELSNNIERIVKENIYTLSGFLSENQKTFAEAQNQKLLQLDKHISEKQQLSINALTNSLLTLEERFKTLNIENERRLQNVKDVVERQLNMIQAENNKRLDDMRKTVDEKLQNVLEEKMTKSFSLVNERLEQVYKGLGEMQNLAVGVGDLKKVLSNVKTRGILGEVQLGAILSEILSPEQYDENVAVVSGSRDVVEFGIKLPADDDGFIYLPIDSKLPLDTFYNYRDAVDNGDKEDIKKAAKALEAVIKSEAKTISEKYINPPDTTNFAIMFLPFESLYAQVVNMGLIEILQRDYRVNIAGPSTMAALLNSLQMGFKTLSVQQHSTEVWKILDSVKTEFDKFATVLETTQQRLEQANHELDTLVGVRTRKIQKQLNSISTLSDELL